jgi:hypothetical protein
MPDEPLKSSFELAMERLKAKDRAEGVTDDKPLTTAQKERIATLRLEAKAKLAEVEILHKKNVAASGADPVALAKLEENYATDRGRIDSRLESAIAKVKRGED